MKLAICRTGSVARRVWSTVTALAKARWNRLQSHVLTVAAASVSLLAFVAMPSSDAQ